MTREHRLGLLLLLVGVLVFILMDDARAKEIYAAPSIIPASMKVCDGLLKLKKLKGRTYATFSQEVAAGGKRVWVSTCLWR